MMCDVGHPMTHSPSMRACVVRDPSFSRSSSLIFTAEAAGPVAMARMAMGA